MIHELLKLARPEIMAMNAYRSARSEQTIGEIWLDANENPWEITPGNNYNRYPEPQSNLLITCLSKLYQVNPEQVLITRGSDEGIDLLVRAFCRAGQDKIMICPPTYGMYKVAATIQHAGVVEIPLLKANNFALDLSAVLENWQPDIKLVFLCSPNNPTGNLLATADILTLCQQLAQQAIVVIDEAYLEFADSESLTRHLEKHANLIVLRTLSKAFGLAGIRCGVTIAHPEIVTLLKKIIAPYPIAQPVLNVALQQFSPENLAYIQEQIKIINQEKNALTLFLKNKTFVKKVWPSAANFLLFEVNDVTTVLNTCAQRGIVIRDRSREYNLQDCLRITIGTPEENKLLTESLNHV